MDKTVALDEHGIPQVSKRVYIGIIACIVFSAIFLNGDVLFNVSLGSILTDLGGFELLSLLFSVKNLAYAIMTVFAGRIADRIGRKYTMLIGLIIGLVGIFLSGTATTILMLIIYRLIGGIGSGLAGGVLYTIIGDFFQGAKRATGHTTRIISSGIAMVGGPILGGVLIQNFAWKWSFWFFIPLAVIAIICAWVFLPHYKVPSKSNKTDVLGILLFAVGMIAAVTVLNTVNVFFRWGDPVILIAAAVAIVCIVAFIIHEKKVDPDIAIFPMALMKKRYYSVAMIGQFCMSLNSTMLLTYAATYMQKVMGTTATASGLSISVIIFIQMIVGTVFVNLTKNRKSHRPFAVITTIWQSIMLFVIWMVFRPTATPMQIYLVFAVFALGAGLEASVFFVITQSILPPRQMSMGSTGIAFVQSACGFVASALGGTIIAANADIGVGIKGVFLTAAIITTVAALIFTVFMPKDAELIKERERGYAEEAAIRAEEKRLAAAK